MSKQKERVMTEPVTSTFHTTIPEELKSKIDVLIFGDFSTIHGDLTTDVCAPCFWEKHCYEDESAEESKEGWICSLIEGVWCVNPKGWIEIK